MFPRGTMERGKRYAASGRVGERVYESDAVSATVHGSRAYETEWLREEDEWMPICNCPVEFDCKHAYALACHVLADRLPPEHLAEPWVADLLPAELVLRLPAVPARSPGGPDPAARVAAVAADRRSRADAASLETLRSARDPWDRQYALSELVRGRRGAGYDAFGEPYRTIVQVEDPDLRCWILARVLAERMDGWAPPVLAPFLSRADLEERHRALLERALSEHVAAWVAGPAAGPARSLRAVFRLAEPVPGRVVVAVEARLTSKRILDEPRTVQQLRQLAGDARRDPHVLLPDQNELLHLLLESAVIAREEATALELSGSALLRLLLGVDGCPLAIWSRDLPEGVAARAGIGPGDPVRLGAGAVSIEPGVNTTGGATRMTLEYFLPQGRALGEEERIVLRGRFGGATREPTLVLADGAFWVTRGDPPGPLGDLFARTGGFDLRRDDAAAIVEPLARTYPRFRESIAPLTRVHRVRVAVCFDLREDDWLQVRAFASAAPGWRPGDAAPGDAALFEWTPGSRWVQAGDGVRTEPPVTGDAVGPIDERPADPDADPAPEPADPGTEPGPPADAEFLLEIPDPERTAVLDSWLETTGAVSGLESGPGGRRPDGVARDVGGWLKLGRKGIERFAAAWDERPAGVEWYGNAAASRLLAPASRAVPRLRVEASGIDWLSVSAEWEAEGLSLTDAELAKLRADGPRFVKLASGWVRRDQVEAMDEAAEALAELGVEPGASERLSVWQLAGARPEAIAALEKLAGADTGALEAVRTLRERIAAFRGLPRVAVPRSIRAELRPYQRDGLDFLAHTSSLGLGAVLADDMGLGKTVQALAWIARLVAREPGSGPSLVVCPASVVHNWEREAARFAPRLKLLTLQAGADRHGLRRGIPGHHLVVTNYALLRRDLTELERVDWRAVILDEAQNIKNPDAAVSRAARALKARHRLALTGTPLENRALDLWSILAFLNPGYLGNRAAFERRYDRADAPPHARRLLAAKLRPVLLRRLKAQVAPELPPRIEERRDCEMTAGQRKLYLAELAKGRAVLERLDGEGGVARNRISILAVLTRLRQVCCHPALVGGRKALGSGKFDALFELLEPLFEEGHKVLVFSQFVECLKLISSAMRSRGIGHHMLTGQSRGRAALVKSFEEGPGPGAFLISLKAGGTGLNLTAASYVVLFDPWWNPAVEAQAIDRTHRIGQDRTVIAYRMLTQGTIEERIWDLQQRKASLMREVLGEDGFGRSLTREDLDFLLAEV
jgi:superfamily II DNA or RNA helicase